MEEQPQPQSVEENAGAPVAQPAATTDDTAAATAPNEPAADEPSSDENLSWLQAKGIDPSSPEALAKLAEMARNAEKKMHESTTKASQLEKAVNESTQVDPVQMTQVEALAAEVAQLKLNAKVSDFFSTNPDAKALEGKMAEIVQERPELGQLVNNGYLSLDDLFALAKTRDAGREEQLKQDGGREALEKVASKQQAKAIQGNATTSALSDSTVTKANFDSWYAGLTAEQRALPENQAIVTSLLSS